MESKSYAALDLETLAALDPNTSYAKIREMVGSRKRVLDVGCGPGNLATILSRMGNVIVGIDRDNAALASAQRVCERTIAADLDAAELDELVGDESFDVVIFADVLEHLRNPVKLLDSSRRVLRDGGNVIVSIPNVAHGAVRLALLRGRFEYQQLGILDDTHIRFYTRESVLRLLSEGGFAAVRVERTTAAVFERSDLVPLVRREDYDPAVVAEVLSDDDAETLQFVVRAAPVAEGQVAAVLSAEITGLQQAVRMLQAQLAQVNDAHADCTPPDRFAEVESHYQNALELAETRRAERDEAVADAARAHAELVRISAELVQREHDVAAATDRANAELARRDAAAASSSAALDDARENYDLAVRALEPLRAELARVQRLADVLASERDAAAARTAVAEHELARANAAAAESNEDVRAARALLTQAEHELNEARAQSERELTQARAQSERELNEARAQTERELNEARAQTAAMRAERDEAALGMAPVLQEAVVARRALQRRANDLESLLAVERTSREHMEEASDRVLAVARYRDERAAHSELRRLLASSAVVDMQLRFATAAQRHVPSPPVPEPVSLPPALVLHAATVGRRTLTMLPPPAGRRERLRAGWRRLRQLLPLLLLLSVGSSA